MQKNRIFISAFFILFNLCISVTFAWDNKYVRVPKSARIHDTVAFDMDGTLIQFAKSYEHAALVGLPYGTNEFWKEVNAAKWFYSSLIKVVSNKLLAFHRALDQRVLLVTKRSGYASHPVRQFLKNSLGFIEEDIFFEKDGKTERLQNEAVGMMYGDADGDMKDALAAGAIPVRILRKSPGIEGAKDYHPGVFNEEIIINSEN